LFSRNKKAHKEDEKKLHMDFYPLRNAWLITCFCPEDNPGKFSSEDPSEALDCWLNMPEYSIILDFPDRPQDGDNNLHEKRHLDSFSQMMIAHMMFANCNQIGYVL
jgi:hypothetical protein